MELATAFDALSRVVDRYESGERAVRRVEAATGGAEGTLHATLEVPVPLEAGPAGSPASATLTDAGRLRVEFTHPDPVSLPEIDGATLSAATREVYVADGEVRRTVELAVTPTAEAGDAREENEATGSEPTTGDRPPGRERDGDGAVAACHDDDPDLDGDSPDPDGADGSERDGGERRLETGAGSAANSREQWGGATGAGGDGGRHRSDSGDETTRTGTETTPDSPEATRDESLPAYDDTAYLRRLYDACDTFAEMSRRIEMDVAAETVRRYMIDAGVHDPDSYDTDTATEGDHGAGSGDGIEDDDRDADTTRDGQGGGASHDDRDADTSHDDGLPPHRSSPRGGDSAEDDPIAEGRLVADGVGLPDGLRVDDVADAVAESATLYEVQRRLDLDRERARTLLERLGLLDLVVRRLADAPERETTYDEIAARLRERPPSGA